VDFLSVGTNDLTHLADQALELDTARQVRRLLDDTLRRAGLGEIVHQRA
jgi:hypothetical protein